MALSYDIEQTVGTISEKSSGWAKELNVVRWGNNRPKFDIREWDPSHEHMGKGVTFTRDELEQLYLILQSMFGDKMAAKSGPKRKIVKLQNGTGDDE